MDQIAHILAVRDSTMEIIMVVVFLVIGLIGQVIKKATERQQGQQRQRGPQRRRAQRRPAGQQTDAARMGQPRPTPPRRQAPPPPPAPRVDPRPELRVQLNKLRVKIEQEQRHLAHMQAQQRELLRLIEPAAELEDVESHRRVENAGAVPLARPVAAAVAGPAPVGRVSLAGREQLRQAILHYEILSPPVALREAHGMWDQ